MIVPAMRPVSFYQAHSPEKNASHFVDQGPVQQEPVVLQEITRRTANVIILKLEMVIPPVLNVSNILEN